MKEVCLCAAVLTTDGYIIRGHRHGDCLRVAHETHRKQAEQGFLTSHGRFVTRIEGRKLQDAAGIPSADADGYQANTLFSEDLY